MRVGVLLLLVLVGSTPTAEAAAPDFTLDLWPGQPPQYTGPQGQATLQESQPGEAYGWSLNLTAPFTVVHVRIHGAFDVDRARQIVPELDDEFFAELHQEDVSDVDGPARVYNVTGQEGEYTYRLGLPGPARSNLTLRRDEEAPGFTVGPVTNLTHRGFLLRTTTSEHALTDLQIRPTAGGATVRNPTPEAAIEQTFPVQGLRPETDYDYWILFWDWSENQARSATFNLTTAAEPDLPEARIFGLEPPAGTTVEADGVVVRARYASLESPVAEGGVRLFFDKREIRDGVVVVNESIAYSPPSLDEGVHSVSVEVLNEAGGTGIARWTFTVASDTPSLTAAATVFLGLAAAAITRRRQAS